ncbi:MAG: 3-phosphoshikimate 1-carboxyvinyltransferase [Candidatus Omnitrophota bacterium]
MLLRVPLVKALRGSVILPASKSYSIRAFFVAACGGVSRVIGPSDCDDAIVAGKVAEAFGARVVPVSGGYRIVALTDVDRRAALKIDVRESGTSLRFVLPLLSFFCSSAQVTGRGTLLGRPNHHLCLALRDRGLKVQGAGAQESVPVIFSGGELPGGRIVIDGSVSSQFISALMIAAPFCRQDTRLVMSGQLVSRDYVLMTRQILARAGIRVIEKSPREFLIPGKQKYKGLKSFHVPSDWGLAAFFMVAAALVPSAITLKGCFDDTLVQSDGAILGFLSRMGLKYSRSPRALKIKGAQELKGGVFSLKDCPDLVPIMAVAAMFAKGPTRLKDIGHARVKESDRISDLRHELLKVGADIREKHDEMVIVPQASYRSGVTLDPHHDHRLAMAFAVLGLRIGVKISDIECTKKSYPGFVKALSAVTLKL